MKKCGKSCTGCPYIKEGNSSKINGVDWKINQTLNCKSFNVVYAVICKKENCRQVYTSAPYREIHYFKKDEIKIFKYIHDHVDIVPT